MTKTKSGLFLGGLLVICSAANAQVEQVNSLTVTNPAGLIATLDDFMAVGEAQASSVTVLQHMIDGTDPSTHTIVAIFDDMEELESSMNRRRTSKAWAAAQRSLSGMGTVNSSLLAIQRRTWGDDGWQEGGYLAAVMVMVSEPRKWMEAMEELNSSRDIRNPGMVRVVRLRGAPATHAVLISAPTYAGLINFMEGTEMSDPFRKMRDATDSRPVGTMFYRVAKVWKP